MKGNKTRRGIRIGRGIRWIGREIKGIGSGIR
jgi:hypothetical protein